MNHKPAVRDTNPIDLPDKPPKLPQEVVDRFPALAAWDDQWAMFWENVRTNIRKRDADLEQRLTKLENP